MDSRPLALGGASGLASSLLVTFLRGLTQDYQGLESLPTVLPDCLEGAVTAFEDTPWLYFSAGILVGASIGPLVDLIWLWRQRWRRFIWAQAASATSGGGKSLHRVLG